MRSARAFFPLALVGRGWGGGGEDSTLSHFQNAVDVRQYVVIPKSEDSITLGFQKLGPPHVTFDLSGVLTAVDLNDNLQAMTGEIDNVVTESHLPAKMRCG